MLAVLSWSPFFMYHDNTLENNGNWSSERANIHELIGGQSFLQNPQPLAFRSLNLGEFFGFNRVFTKQKFENLKTITFDAWFTADSYLYFMFDISEDSLNAILIEPGKSEATLRKIKKSGEFISSISSPLSKEPTTGTWISLRISFEKERVGVSIDGAPETWFRWIEATLKNNIERQNIGFQSGYHPVFVDSVTFLNEIGMPVFKENFDSAYSFRNINQLPFIILLALYLIELFFLKFHRFSPFFSSTINVCSLSLILAGVIASSWYLPHLASKHIVMNYKEVFSREKHVEERRPRLIQELKNKISTLSESSTKKILFLGSSQTEGFAAYVPEKESFPPVLENLLNSDKKNTAYRCLPLGVSSYYIREILNEYEDLLQTFTPSISFLNIAHNDEIYGVLNNYSSQVERFISLSKEHGVQAVLIKEAVSSELKPSGLNSHTILEKVSKEHQIPLLDAHTCMTKKAGSGLLWWDQIHPTNYGHQVLAECIFEFMKENNL